MKIQIIYWVTLFSDAVTLLISICATAKKPVLRDFFIVGLAMCTFAAALDHVLSGRLHSYTLILTAALNLLLLYRVNNLLKSSRRKS